MFSAAKIYFIVFGILTIAGGIVGYMKANSTASIIAGSISGVLLLVAAFLLPGQPLLGLTIAFLISVLLAGYFVPGYLRTGKIMPGAIMAVLSLLGIVCAIVAWLRK